VPAYAKDWTAGLEPSDFRFGIEVETDAAGNQQVRSGSFRRRSAAETYLKKIQVGYPEAQLVTSGCKQ
jgi:hypothetical protein